MKAMLVSIGATENAAVAKALLADLVARGLKPDIARLFIVDGAKALSRAVRDTFGDFALIQRCQIHKGRNIIERLDPSLHASVKKVLRQAWDSPTAEQALANAWMASRWRRSLFLSAPTLAAELVLIDNPNQRPEHARCPRRAALSMGTITPRFATGHLDTTGGNCCAAGSRPGLSAPLSAT
jgi:hypothetical protein